MARKNGGMSFDEKVQHYGSVQNALEATGHSKGDDGAWHKTGEGNGRINTSNDDLLVEMEKEASKGSDANWDKIGDMGNGFIPGYVPGVFAGTDTTENRRVMDYLQHKYGYDADEYYGNKYDAIHGKGAWADPNYWGYDGQSVDKKYADAVAQSGNHGAPGGGVGKYAPVGGSSSKAEIGYSGGNVTDLTDVLKQRYADQMEAELAQLGADFKNAAAQYGYNDEAIDDLFMAQKNEAAAQNDIQKMYANELGSATGMNTGATGQFALGNSMALQGALAGIGAEQAAAQAKNDLALQQLRDKYDADSSAIRQRYDAMLEEALYKEAIRQDEARKAEYYARQEAEQAAQKAALDNAKLLAQYGDFSGFAALGYDTSEMERNWDIQHASKGKSNGGGGGNPYNAYFDEEDDLPTYDFTPDDPFISAAQNAPKIDMLSLTRAAGGPVSPETLVMLEQSGEVVPYEEDGVIKFTANRKPMQTMPGFDALPSSTTQFMNPFTKKFR